MSSDAQHNITAWLNGSSGKMGKEIQAAAKDHVFRIVGGNGRTFEGDPFLLGQKVTPNLLGGALKKDHVAFVFDFTNPEGNRLLHEAIDDAKITNLSVLIGSTGMSDKDLEKWQHLAKTNVLSVLIAPNTSIGVLISSRLAAEAGAALYPKGFDIEIVETHHRAKLDAPSGTAKHYASLIMEKLDRLKLVFPRTGKRQTNEIGMHAIRAGGVFGEHEVRFISDDEEVKVSHRAFSRMLFSKGALTLGVWLKKQKPGFYRLEDIKLADL